ncbi:UDP-4-amino-4,6-dideoxy-N-acetyl-beta-L-altrosamine transaminase [Polaromonas sp. SM01]|uniref:UDP-4-amino-4, 6-dideoxy-N-acetyl-beta-L-altrosamine transaminase n=1 Tax=Polaromonas sp. SM01 TaxID=3085630 RepID=UPI0029829D45|nr:UDP-4-amino-4,6-dideoxy-N-acetyl-beta-L-altrosamine transaminase [Polaromonas sp. SM01]MDW5443922.1 UDP-4-amino-4,6-dideoxy-N-acetyl-beta-L-altrosamine transaminase [Polaromonas sp. SM01]
MMIPYGRQDISQADIDAVVEVLRSDFLTQGPTIPRFEQAVATHVGARYAVAVNSATSALHIACLALGLGSGDRLWTVPNTFVASANCGRYCGAEVDFVDIDPDTWNISVTCLREKLIDARARQQLPKIVVPVHFSGQPTDQEAIWALAQEFGFKVLEDASHAIGASHRAEPVGSCRWSDITIFSFHPVKIVTTGEGGLALTNDAALAERMALFRSHGITRDAQRFRASATTENASASALVCPAAWYYEQQELGYNYRMTDIQAVLGVSQLGRLQSYVARRNLLAQRYDAKLGDLPLTLPTILDHNISAFHLYVVRIQPAQTPKTHRQIFDELRSKGVGVNLHYMPVHLQPYYQDLGFTAGQFPEAEAHGSQAISLPLFPTLTFEQQDDVVLAVRNVLGHA